MQNDVEHIVLTRFNLVGIGGMKSEQEWLRWNADRFQLFQSYCLPSMLQQTATFTWHLYFDEQTPEQHLPEIRELETHTFIRTFFLAGKELFFRDHMQELRGTISPDKRWLITTRVDNDDCLHAEALAAVQDRFEPRDQLIINLSSGYAYHLESGFMSHYYYMKSPFQSVVEDLQKETLMGVYHKRHSHWQTGKAAPWGRVIKSVFTGKRSHVYLLKKPYWIQLIHGDNVSNDAMRGFPLLRSRSLDAYGIRQRNKASRVRDIPRYYHFIWWKWYVKGFLMRLLGLSGS